MGGASAAGIGGRQGAKSTVGTITIAGGSVTAQGGEGGAGIGGGYGGAGGTVTISGGSVKVVDDLDDGDAALASVLSDDLKQRVYCVVVTNLTPNARVACPVVDLRAWVSNYGTNDVYADEDGRIYLWLPDGVYEIRGEGGASQATVDGAATTAVFGAPRPVMLGSVAVADGTFRITVLHPMVGATYEIRAANSLTESFASTGVSATAVDETQPLVLEVPLGDHVRRFFKVRVTSAQ